MSCNPIRISETDAASECAPLIAKVRAGAEVVIENGGPTVVLRLAPPAPRTLAESVELLPEKPAATIDPDFAADVESVVESHREPVEPPTSD
jgi:antitoxin (DNA-binding transcriptional repressor) of toxin-antitoxin stability system